MLVVLVASLVVNVVLALVVVARYTRSPGRRRRNDYAMVAADAFGPVIPGQVVIAGDELVADAPLAEMLTGVSQRGLAGQRINDLNSWVPHLRDASRVVLWVGTHDWADGISARRLRDRFGRLLDHAHGEIAVVGLVNPSASAALAELCEEKEITFIPLPDLSGCVEADGIHLTHEGYLRLAPALRDFVTPRPSPYGPTGRR